MSNQNEVHVDRPPAPPGYVYIFVRRFWHKRGRRYIHAKPGKSFCFLVKARVHKPRPRKKAA